MYQFDRNETVLFEVSVISIKTHFQRALCDETDRSNRRKDRRRGEAKSGEIERDREKGKRRRWRNNGKKSRLSSMPCDEWIRFDMKQNAIVKLNGLDGIIS